MNRGMHITTILCSNKIELQEKIIGTALKHQHAEWSDWLRHQTFKHIILTVTTGQGSLMFVCGIVIGGIVVLITNRLWWPFKDNPEFD